MNTFIIFALSMMTISALVNFILQRHHILMALLSLEASILTLAALTSSLASSPALSSPFFCIVILTFGACEASVALATLVLISRSFGSDTLKSLSTSKC